MFVDHPFYVILGFHPVCVRHLMSRVGTQSTLLASYRLFETTYPSHIEGSSSPKRIVNEMFALVGCYAAQIGSYRRFGTTCGSIFRGQAVQPCWTALPLKMGRVVCPGNVGKYQSACQTSQESKHIIIQADYGARRFL